MRIQLYLHLLLMRAELELVAFASGQRLFTEPEHMAAKDVRFERWPGKMTDYFTALDKYLFVENEPDRLPCLSAGARVRRIPAACRRL